MNLYWTPGTEDFYIAQEFKNEMNYKKVSLADIRKIMKDKEVLWKDYYIINEYDFRNKYYNRRYVCRHIQSCFQSIKLSKNKKNLELVDWEGKVMSL